MHYFYTERRMPDMSPKIFIGSSKESLPTARQIKNFFDKDCDCTLWRDNFFQLNQSTYDNLLKKAPLYDYAIFVGGIDDLVTRTGTFCKKKKVRDNIYFELGLYTGILTKERTFFFVHEDVKIATDLLGITLIFYKDDILSGCQQVKDKITEEEKLSRISLLPSTSLAINYFYNFLVPLGKELSRCTSLTVDSIESSIQTQSIQIVIPDGSTADLESWANEFYAVQKCSDYTFCSASRNLSVKFELESLRADQSLKILDVPQTLRGSFEAVKLVTETNHIGFSDIEIDMREKEISNFIKTLRTLIKSNPTLSCRTTILHNWKAPATA